MRNLSKGEKSWIMYDWANSAYSTAITATILPLYFKSIALKSGVSAASSTAYWGYSNSIATLLIAILSPILGTMADYKGYKMKLFNVFFILGTSFTLLLSVVPTNYWLLIILFYILTSIGFSGSCIFYDAFLVDVSDNDNMDRVSSLGFGMGYIGSNIPFILCILIIALAQLKIIPISFFTACKISFAITALWWAIFTIPMIKNVKQTYSINIEKNPARKSFLRLKSTLKDIKKHKQLFIFLLSYFFYIDGVNTIITMATSYGSDLGINSTTMLVILLVMQFIAFPFSIIFGMLAKKFQGKTMLYVGIVIYSIICVYSYFLRSTLDFWILAILVGTSQGGIQALSRSYLGKLVPKNKANEFFGFYNIFGKFSAILGPFMVGIVSQVTGNSNKGVLSILVLFLIGGIILKKVPSYEKSEKESNVYST
ncbi:UMF1 family MFS transporter [Clostridium acetobutylicum]|uniref:MDR-type permease n=1 Tax=Clostridium acetobutylicum (strain ATCC 824 / DSM 792 / JCM 1419 / IAM 19013 / LMG 5710 / NBRC 13948 / NRRL B-527 / VKM B-1787 / 2291 / W) TaxID=272562 RepID=Q97IQ5_CLOAB|nr:MULTISPECIES: MFS transporter [Clostridium]AAK79552.1 MDR-type permease [Clostridium acetobutylicum ATCC 824]ADZ20637.1 MDR-type permease [Clostridium acetobutylicum EA 2018]AEI34654.1 MDR-type permease [Clostridium acetobutylicum DSM 1731]AWV81205.1 MFS transporter [Clostridium acetobutylicum]MBC2392836.1 MFS transporter [Clostridium acetobutylicum]